MNYFKGRAYYLIRFDNFKDEWFLSDFSKEKNTSSKLISILGENASDFFSSKIFTIADGKYIRNLIVIHIRKEEFDAAYYYSNIMVLFVTFEVMIKVSMCMRV